MFRHQGKHRTLSHNLQIASLLSFVAGIVNVSGFLAVQKLTTNVTGHFAYFLDELFKLNFNNGFVYFLYIFFFFMGSFTSGFLIELFSRKTERNIYVFPTSIEILLLFMIGLSGQNLITKNPNFIAYTLLFAMGLQNSLVTKISNATVRTTHLTGLFTDLGIELSQLFFLQRNRKENKTICFHQTAINHNKFLFHWRNFSRHFVHQTKTTTIVYCCCDTNYRLDL